MNILEEVFDKYDFTDYNEAFDGENTYTVKIINEFSIKEAMKEFARIMCQKQKEICAEEAKLEYTDGDVDKNSILNSPFPTELQDEI